MRLSPTTLAFIALLGTPLFGQSQRYNFATSAPTPGGTLKLSVANPATASGNSYAWMLSIHTDKSFALPSPYKGRARVDLNAMMLVAAGTLKATPSTTAIMVPNTPSLVGVLVDAQSIDVDANTGTLTLAINDIVIKATKTVGTSLFARVTPGGDTKLQTVVDSNMGAPQTNKAYIPELVRFVPPRGWAQGYDPRDGLQGRINNLAPESTRADAVSYNGTDVAFRTIDLPNGLAFGVMRDAAKQREFVCITLDRKTGKITELSGSRIASLWNTAKPFNPYGDYWQFTKDGKVAIGIVDNLNPLQPATPDRAIMIRTDNSNWPGTSSATLDITLLTSSLPAPQFYDGEIMLANEVVFFRGSKKPALSTIPFLRWAPLDGSSKLQEIAEPMTGTGRPNTSVITRSFRVSGDGKTVVYPYYYTSPTPVLDHDIIAITNISKSTMTVRNVTGFKTNHRIERPWGDVRQYAHTFKAALSQDGKRVAFFAKLGQSAVIQMFVAKTDGSDKGKLTPVKGFPTGTLAMGTPHFLPDPAAGGDLVLFAGATIGKLDLYRVKGDLSGVTNLTNKADLQISWTLTSKSGWLYTGRDHPGTSTNRSMNLIGVNPKTGVVTDITGTEFQSGTGADVQLTHLSVMGNQFRMHPNTSSTEMFFVAAEITGTPKNKVDDQNVWKFDFEKGTRATKVTTYSSPGATQLHELRLRPDGAMAFVRNAGASGALVHFKAPGKAPIQFGDKVYLDLWPVLGYPPRSIDSGSLRLVGNGLVWMQGQTGCFAQIDSTQEHALFLTGLPIPFGQKLIPIVFSDR